jgi:hypothetical protein
VARMLTVGDPGYVALLSMIPFGIVQVGTSFEDGLRATIQWYEAKEHCAWQTGSSIIWADRRFSVAGDAGATNSALFGQATTEHGHHLA